MARFFYGLLWQLLFLIPLTCGATPFYIGGAGGYGSTTWQGLVPAPGKQNVAISMSTPEQVTEGGGVWGVWTGYEFGPLFALEANYTRYANAKVTFVEESLFSFDHDGLVSFDTQTETVSLMAKFMLFVPQTLVRAYSSFGIAEVHRTDLLFNHWNVSPTFGLGLNYNVTPHWMIELVGNYTAGYGESELNPVEDYVPFLYSVMARVAYRV